MATRAALPQGDPLAPPEGGSRKEELKLRPDLSGQIFHAGPGISIRTWHRHDELELNLVTKGTSSYLLGDRRYDLHSDVMVWLFPDQDHVLIDWSPDFEMWIALFRPESVVESKAEELSAGLVARNPSGSFCRRLARPAADRLGMLLAEV